ncbi:MAG TPA: TonB family protein [Kofleriaceae bacterium]|jgi:TonB family protein|nr:TonB family protein [Kofleriaceae bacterium]
MSRRWLIALSVTAHLCILTGVFISGIWRLERLEGGPPRFALAVQPPPPPPAPAGARKAPPPPNIIPRVPRRVVTAHRQPVTQMPPLAAASSPEQLESSGPATDSDGPVAATCTENCAPGPAAEPVCGNGSVEAGEQCDDGNTASGDGCSATCRIEIKPPPPPATVAPGVLAGLRTSGQTQVHPDEVTQNQMIRDGAGHVEAVVKLCISADGGVGSTRLLVSTKYPAYDAALIAAVASWRYQPYRVNQTAVAACSTVRFVYTIQ